MSIFHIGVEGIGEFRLEPVLNKSQDAGIYDPGYSLGKVQTF